MIVIISYKNFICCAIRKNSLQTFPENKRERRFFVNTLCLLNLLLFYFFKGKLTNKKLKTGFIHSFYYIYFVADTHSTRSSCRGYKLC